MSAPTTDEITAKIAYDALPPTQPITLPMRDEFGTYYGDWDAEH